MLRLFIFIFLINFNIFAIENKTIIVSGETNYEQQKTKSIKSNLSGEYRYEFYEHKSKSFVLYVQGKIVMDYDVFGKELKNNVFTTFGIDF